jgi:hypothetical protein
VNGKSPFSFANFSQNQPLLNIEMLKDPRVSITVEGSASGTLNLQATVKMLEAFNSEDLVLYCAVVQKISEVTEPINGVTEFYNVLRAFVPDPGGTQLKSSWTQGETQSFSLSWPIPADVNTEMLRIILFVQNIQTGKIYQTEIFDASPSTTSKPQPESITVSVYPNPASNFVRLVSPQIIEQASVIDISGRILKTFEPNDFIFDIPVQHMVNGLYFVKLKLRNGQTVVRFVKE